MHAVHEATVTKRTSAGLGHHVSKPTTITSLHPLPHQPEHTQSLLGKTSPNALPASHSCPLTQPGQGGVLPPSDLSSIPGLSGLVVQLGAPTLPNEGPASIKDCHAIADMGKHTPGTFQLQGLGDAAHDPGVLPYVNDPIHSTLIQGGNGQRMPGSIHMQFAGHHLGPDRVSHEAPSESSEGHASLPSKTEERKWAGTRRPVTRGNVQRGSRLLNNKSLTGSGALAVAPAPRMARESLYGGTASSVVESEIGSVRETTLFGGFRYHTLCGIRYA